MACRKWSAADRRVPQLGAFERRLTSVNTSECELEQHRPPPEVENSSSMNYGGSGLSSNAPGFILSGTGRPALAKKSTAFSAAPKYTTWPSDSRHSLSNSANTSEEGWWMTLQGGMCACVCVGGDGAPIHSDRAYAATNVTLLQGMEVDRIGAMQTTSTATRTACLTTVRQCSARRRTAAMT